MKTVRVSEVIAAGLAIAIAVPIVFMFARAMTDGELRKREAPLRGMLGDAAYEAIARGDTTPQHYFGNDRRAPDFTLRDRDGKEWKLSDHRGKVIVLNFWSITCEPCIAEMPTFEALDRMMRARGDVEVVTVSTDAGWDEVAAIFAPKSALKVLFDPEKRVVLGKFGTPLYPETWIIDPRGVIRARVDGPRDWSSALAIDLIESYL